jgi:putative transposase
MRAVDKTGQTIDFLLTEHRDERAAKHFLAKAIRRHGVPEKVTIDGSEANAAAIRSYGVIMMSMAPPSPFGRSNI